MDVIYFDQAATSWPKPPAVTAAMTAFHESVGASPGRSAHRRSLDAGRTVLGAREAVAGLFGVADPLRIVFTKNATEALNLVIFGLLEHGDHCIASSLEHNSVMRPLRALEAQGVELSLIPCSARGELDPHEIIPLIKPNTKAVLLTHASNVTGAIMPIAEVASIARDNGLVLCVDAAQTAGALPIDVKEMDVDFLVFTGHKSLFGPQGTGGLYIRPGFEDQLRPLMMGGTGSRSEYEVQPDFMPDKFESGTPNSVGLAGLEAGVNFILDKGMSVIRAYEESLTEQLLAGLTALEGVRVYGPPTAHERTAVVSFTLANLSPSDAALILDEEYDILCRPGLHCAPAAHKIIGTFPEGTIRFSLSFFNTPAQIDRALSALDHLIRR
ncbi:MAG: aminotransferase class V-fold PLP-dependent enzyme [Syntrophaceae bacterium]